MLLEVKSEPSELGEVSRVSVSPAEQAREVGPGGQNGGRVDRPDADAGSQEAEYSINRDHLNKELWKATIQCFRGASKIRHEINNTLSFLDELDRTELNLEDSIFSLDLVQSVFVPKDVSPELITRFIDFTKVITKQ